MNRTFIYLVACVILLSLARGAIAQKNGRSLSLDALISEALQNNPEIKSAEGRWRAFEARPDQVSALPDPMFSYSRFGSSVETRVGPQQGIFMLSQKIPFPGKLGLQGRMAGQDALAEQQKYETTRRDIVFKVKTTYYDLFWIDQSVRILDQYLDLLKDFTKVAEQKYATGQGIQANVLKSQVEISSTMERTLKFKKMREGTAARINALLDRQQDRPVEQATHIDTTRMRFAEAALVDHALRHREELQMIDAMVGKSEYMRQLARKSYLPDFNLQMNYIDISKGASMAPDAGKNAWSVTLGLNLPIWLGKRNAAVHEADEMVTSNRMTYENLENQIKAEIKDIHYQLQLTGTTLDLYDQALIAQAESSLQSAMASYGSGKLDFLSLLDAERMLLNLNLSYIKEQSDYQKQIAAMTRAVGGELP